MFPQTATSRMRLLLESKIHIKQPVKGPAYWHIVLYMKRNRENARNICVFILMRT